MNIFELYMQLCTWLFTHQQWGIPSWRSRMLERDRRPIQWNQGRERSHRSWQVCRN